MNAKFLNLKTPLCTFKLRINEIPFDLYEPEPPRGVAPLPSFFTKPPIFNRPIFIIIYSVTKNIFKHTLH